MMIKPTKLFRLTVPYVLANRALDMSTLIFVDYDGQQLTAPYGQCIFCGREVYHYNDVVIGWIIHVLHDGKTQFFYYCDQISCDGYTYETEEIKYKMIWHCHCCDIENIGELCAICHNQRNDKFELTNILKS